MSSLPLHTTDWAVVAVFATVYLGMFLGGLPRLKLDRSGVALLGAIAVIVITGLPLEDAARAVDLPTIVLLFAFMVVSAQMRQCCCTSRGRWRWSGAGWSGDAPGHAAMAGFSQPPP